MLREPHSEAVIQRFKGLMWTPVLWITYSE